MSFLDEAVYNVEKGAMPPDPQDLEDDDVVNIGEKSPDNIGYGIDPETGKFKSMSSNDAIKHFLAKVKQGIKDEEDEGSTLKEDLSKLIDKGTKLIKKAGGAEYKTPFTDFVDDIKSLLDKDKDKSPDERKKFITKFANIHKAPQDEFDAFIKDLGKEGYDRSEITKIIKKRKEYKAKQSDEVKKKEEEEYKKDNVVKEETITGEYEGKPVKFKIKDITNLKDILNISKSAKDFVNKISMAVTDETSSLSKEDAKKLILFYKKRTMKEAEDIKLPSDTTFTVDLKHLVKKHMNKGNDKESAIKFTKALMKKLHNKGEVNVDGTKVIFKEHKTTQDVPMELPAAETPNFLGDDGMDYEGGMAKSQMLKMKKYVDALSNMIEDESQLESWVQAKLTKASDYMSAVYHYLDYQKSKMNELNEAEMSVNVNRKDDEVEVTYKGERYKSALGDKLVFIHYFKDGEYHGENDAPKTFKYLKGKGGKLEVDEKEATLTINMSNLNKNMDESYTQYAAIIRDLYPGKEFHELTPSEQFKVRSRYEDFN